jgi:hypothetical protein
VNLHGVYEVRLKNYFGKEREGFKNRNGLAPF